MNLRSFQTKLWKEIPGEPWEEEEGNPQLINLQFLLLSAGEIKEIWLFLMT